MRPISTAAVGLALIGALTASSWGWKDDQKGDPVAASGSGNGRSYNVSGFSQIDLRGADNVDVRVGPAFAVRAEGPADELDRLRLARDGDTLRIGRRDGAGFKWGRSRPVLVHVSLPRLAGAAVSGSGAMTIDRVEGGAFGGAVSGSGKLDIGALRVDDASFSIAGSGDARVAGSARSLKVNIAGSGNLVAPGLRASSARVSVAGSGDARATVNGDATVSIMGSGNVDLGPNARCKVSRMGSGSVRCAR